MSQCGKCNCGEYDHEQVVDSDGSYMGDFRKGTNGFTPQAWYFPGWSNIPGGCNSAHYPGPGECTCPCSYKQQYFPYDAATDTPGPFENCPDNNEGSAAWHDTIPYTTPFAMQNPALDIKGPVFDASGPPGLESQPALQVWYSGHSTDGPNWFAKSDNASGTGFTLGPTQPFNKWYIDFWIKSVPDHNNYTVDVADGFRVGAVAGSDHGTPGGGYLGASFTDPLYGGSGLVLTPDWRWFHGILDWHFSTLPTITNACVNFARTGIGAARGALLNAPCCVPTGDPADHCGGRAEWKLCCNTAQNRKFPTGSALIKCFHIYPFTGVLKGSTVSLDNIRFRPHGVADDSLS